MNQSRPIAEAQRSSARPQGRLLPLPLALALSTMPLLVAVGIAFLWPTTYATRAVVLLEPLSAAATQALAKKDPVEVAKRFQSALLEPAELPIWTKALGTANDSASTERTKGALRVWPESALSYAIEVRWRTATQVEQATNAAAQRIVERAARDLGILSERAKAETELERRTRELATFLAAHPELALDAPPGEESGERPGNITVETLKKERARLERMVAEAERRPKTDSDNPYVDPQPRVEELRARLAHVRSALAAYESAARKKTPTKSASPQLKAEWMRLVQALAEARKLPEAAPSVEPAQPGIAARVVAKALLPRRPEKPNRFLILGIGTIVTVGLSVLMTAIALARSGIRLAPSGRLPQRPVPLPARSDPPPPNAGDPVAPDQLAQDPVQRVSSRPPPGAGMYALSVNKPDSDPPPPEHVGPIGAQGRKSPVPAPAAPQVALTPAPQILPPAPEAAFGQVPWMEGKRVVNVEESAPLPAAPLALPPAPPPTAAPAPAPAGAGNGAPVLHEPARRPSQRPRQPMKRTTTLIHGSMIQPDDMAPGAPQMHHAGAMPVIEAEGEVVVPKAAALPATPGVQTPGGASVTGRGGVKLSSVGAYWKPPSVRPSSGWLTKLRDELCGVAVARSLGRCFVVMISCSPGSRQAKSEAVAQLSLALSENGHMRILLMEGDFDRPMVHQVMGIEMPRGAGFSQQMHARIHGGQAASSWAIIECLPNLHVLAEGRMRSPGLLHSFQFEGAVVDLRRNYEMIVIDGPPLAVSTDMRALEAVVDGVIIIALPGDRGPTPVELALFGKKLLKTATVEETGPAATRT